MEPWKKEIQYRKEVQMKKIPSPESGRQVRRVVYLGAGSEYSGSNPIKKINQLIDFPIYSRIWKITLQYVQQVGNIDRKKNPR